MTLGGWILMSLAVSSVTLLFAWSLYLTFTRKN